MPNYQLVYRNAVLCVALTTIALLRVSGTEQQQLSACPKSTCLFGTSVEGFAQHNTRLVKPLAQHKQAAVIL